MARKEEAMERMKKMRQDRRAKKVEYKELKKNQKFVLNGKPLYKKLDEIFKKKEAKQKRLIDAKIKRHRVGFEPLV